MTRDILPETALKNWLVRSSYCVWPDRLCFVTHAACECGIGYEYWREHMWFLNENVVIYPQILSIPCLACAPYLTDYSLSCQHSCMNHVVNLGISIYSLFKTYNVYGTTGLGAWTSKFLKNEWWHVITVIVSSYSHRHSAHVLGVYTECI